MKIGKLTQYECDRISEAGYKYAILYIKKSLFIQDMLSDVKFSQCKKSLVYNAV